MAYFFFSYALMDDDGVRLPKFYKELKEEVMRIAACTDAAAAFFDQEQKRGVEWTVNITTALAQSSTMVCLYSPRYFQQEYCGKEFQAFLLRRSKYKEKFPNAIPTNIIPVRWVPGGDQVPIPNFFVSRKKDSTYESQGLDAVLELAINGDKDESLWYIKFKRQLAADILRAARRFVLDPLPLPLNMLGVENAFEVRRPRVVMQQSEMDAGPNSATFVYVGGPDNWEWVTDPPASFFAPPPQDVAGSVASAIADRIEIVPQQIPISSDTFNHLDYLESRSSRVIVLVNGQTITQKSVREWLIQYEQKKYKNCATLILGSPAPNDVFQSANTRPKELFRDDIDKVETLSEALITSLGALKPAIIHTSSTQRPGPPNPPGFQSPPVVAGPGSS